MNGPRSRPGTLGLYLHLPFCRAKCPYCDFYSLAGRTDLVSVYLDALARQAHHMAELPWTGSRQVSTIFFGGGTPSILAPAELAGLLALCRRLFPVPAAGVETTVEVNPATVDRRALDLLRRAGFNRVSIGVQSLDDRLLGRIGRVHTAADAVRTVRSARQAGFANLGLDLMYGLPGQDLATWRRTLEQALALAPDHLSLYELTLEEGTPFARRAAAGELLLPDEEEVLAMMALGRELAEGAGLRRYEISNYARSGHECRHNINYWQNGSYIGLGAGAVSCLSGRRLTAVADVEAFCRRLAAGEPVWSDEERLTPAARFRETVVMGLRMIRGVDLVGLEARFGMDARSHYGPTLERLLDQGLLAVHDGRLCLTARGLPLANRVMAELV